MLREYKANKNSMRTVWTLQALRALTVPPSPPRLSLVATDFTLSFHLHLSEVGSAQTAPTRINRDSPDPRISTVMAKQKKHHLDIHLSLGKDCKKRKMKKALRLTSADLGWLRLQSPVQSVQSVHLQFAVAQAVQAQGRAWRWCSKSCRRFNSPRLRKDDRGRAWMTKGLRLLCTSRRSLGSAIKTLTGA